MSTFGAGLLVQRLPRTQDRVLVIGHACGTRAGDNWFTPGGIRDMFELLRLPSPGNVSQELARLAGSQMVVRRRSGGLWSLTPAGKERTVSLVGSIDLDALEAEIAASDGADFDGARHALLPPEFAPVRFLPAVQRIVAASPFDQNVFCMTRFPRDDDPADDPVGPVIGWLREALLEHGLTLQVASDKASDDELFGNVASHMWASKYGIAILETRNPRMKGRFNENVVAELGAMLVTGRRCALLKDPGAPSPPSDFVAHIYREVDLLSESDVRAAAESWVLESLGLTGPS